MIEEKTQNKIWQNRIVGSGEEDVDQILFNPHNWRIHPKPQQEALQEVLEKVGWVQQVIINRRTGHLVDGHMRVQLADRNGEKKIPVLYVDLSEEEENIILATLDPISAMAAADKRKLNELLSELKENEEQVVKQVEDLGLEIGEKILLGGGNFMAPSNACVVTVGHLIGTVDSRRCDVNFIREVTERAQELPGKEKMEIVTEICQLALPVIEKWLNSGSK